MLGVPGASYQEWRATPELESFLDAFFDSLAGRHFDWDAKPLRWRQAMRVLSREYQAINGRTQQSIAAHLKAFFS